MKRRDFLQASGFFVVSAALGGAGARRHQTVPAIVMPGHFVGS
jgi:hypothetical protein